MTLINAGQRAADQPHIMFFGFRRGGSSVSFSILQHLFINSGYRAADLAATYHQFGIALADVPASAIADAVAENELLGCFRDVPNLSLVDMNKVKPILVIRDPRDCQLSWFHARYLHIDDAVPVRPIAEAKLHEPLCDEDNFENDFRRLHDFVKNYGGLILRYEDLVADPVGFLDAVVEFVALQFDRHAYDSALMEANFIQGLADVGAHNRSGVPGARGQGEPVETWQKFEEKFGQLAVELGYPLRQGELVSPAELRRWKERDAMKRYLLVLATENAMRVAEVAQQSAQIQAIQTQLDNVAQLSRSLLEICENMGGNILALSEALERIQARSGCRAD